MTPSEFNAQFSFQPFEGETPPVLAGVDNPTDTKYRAATFIETYTGRAFWPLQPLQAGFSIIDIAHHLSNQCRYSGAVRFFYSVAQHCVHLADYVERELGGSPLDCLQILMHDAPEAYLVDVPRPVKQYMPQYRAWDHVLDVAIREWMQWGSLDRLPYQDDLDTRVIVDERAVLFGQSGNDWGHRMEPVGITITRMTPEEAEREFLMRYAIYTRKVYGLHDYINYQWGVPVKTLHQTASDSRTMLDVIEADRRGGVAKVRLLNSDGTGIRDRSRAMPEFDWSWEHGKFEISDRVAA